MKNGILFIGGLSPSAETVKKITGNTDLICAADSGLETAVNAGIKPDGIVGDMDSLKDKAMLNLFPQEIINIYPQDKDDSDTVIGLKWLKARNCTSVTLIGGGEGRLDHTLSLISIFCSELSVDKWFTALELIIPLSGRTVLYGETGNTVSVIPVCSAPWKIESRGLKWELDELEWNSSIVSLSNRFASDTVELNAGKGKFLVIRPLEEVL